MERSLEARDVDNEIQIEKVGSRSAFKLYRDFPRAIYKDDPNWVPPLNADFKEKLDVTKNPFFEHAERELFLAYRDRRPVGRALGIVDRNHNTFHNEKVVFFGQYESFNEPDVTRALLDAVAAWGRERGMTILRGPVNLSLNDECAMLLEGFDSPPAVMMPYNPKYYNDLMEQYGLVKAKDLLAFLMTRDHKVVPDVQAIIDRFQRQSKITIRPFKMKDWKREAEIIKFIYNNAWERNWGFVPWTDREMDHMVKVLRPLGDPDIIAIAEDDGKPIGFGFAFPNYNEVLIRMNGRLTPWSILKFLWLRKRIKGVRILVFGILKPYRLTGVSYLLFDFLNRNVVCKGYQWAETSWQLEDNDAVNKFVISVGGTVYKKYRIYEKKLA
jgi:hypothetical protein